MKKYKFILVFALLGLVLNSCDDKSEMNYVQKNNLAGKWKITQIGTVNAANGIDYAPYQSDAACGTDVDDITFNEDLTYLQNDYNGTSGTCENTAVSGTYVQSNHNLSLTHLDADSGDTIIQSILITTLDYTHLGVSYTDDLGHMVFLKLERE